MDTGLLFQMLLAVLGAVALYIYRFCSGYR
ncbi:hypothetical protein A5880_002259 [Enterococcus sp. 4G2_DIV0659]|uniref:Uncharacterized protein n=1 Tax=Candidatus Enterococcus mansonii TaxID=1834181 RepID=A0ABU8IH15_9ENTE